jgi:hypothetical protein
MIGSRHTQSNGLDVQHAVDRGRDISRQQPDADYRSVFSLQLRKRLVVWPLFGNVDRRKFLDRRANMAAKISVLRELYDVLRFAVCLAVGGGNRRRRASDIGVDDGQNDARFACQHGLGAFGEYLELRKAGQ